MTAMIAPPVADKLESEVPAVVQQANAITVTDPASAAKAADFLRTIKTMLGRVADAYDGIVEAAHKAHKTAVAKRKEFTDPLQQAESVIKRRIGDYQMAEERKRRELEDKLRREAEEAARIETERLRAAEETRRLEEAMALEASGDKVAADEILEAPVVVEQVIAAPVIVAPTAPKLEGVSGRTTWRYRIINAALIPREYLMPNETMIGGTVRAQKDKTKIPGVEVYPDTSISARGF